MQPISCSYKRKHLLFVFEVRCVLWRSLWAMRRMLFKLCRVHRPIHTIMTEAVLRSVSDLTRVAVILTPYGPPLNRSFVGVYSENQFRRWEITRTVIFVHTHLYVATKTHVMYQWCIVWPDNLADGYGNIWTGKYYFYGNIIENIIAFKIVYGGQIV
jgi:hypothetical protein